MLARATRRNLLLTLVALATACGGAADSAMPTPPGPFAAIAGVYNALTAEAMPMPCEIKLSAPIGGGLQSYQFITDAQIALHLELGAGASHAEMLRIADARDQYRAAFVKPRAARDRHLGRADGAGRDPETARIVPARSVDVEIRARPWSRTGQPAAQGVAVRRVTLAPIAPPDDLAPRR